MPRPASKEFWKKYFSSMLVQRKVVDERDGRTGVLLYVLGRAAHDIYSVEGVIHAKVAWFDSQGRLDVHDDEIVDATRLAAILRDEWVLYGDDSLDAPHVVQLLKPLQEADWSWDDERIIATMQQCMDELYAEEFAAGMALLEAEMATSECQEESGDVGLKADEVEVQQSPTDQGEGEEEGAEEDKEEEEEQQQQEEEEEEEDEVGSQAEPLQASAADEDTTVTRLEPQQDKLSLDPEALRQMRLAKRREQYRARQARLRAAMAPEVMSEHMLYECDDVGDCDSFDQESSSSIASPAAVSNAARHQADAEGGLGVAWEQAGCVQPTAALVHLSEAGGPQESGATQAGAAVVGAPPALPAAINKKARIF